MPRLPLRLPLRSHPRLQNWFYGFTPPRSVNSGGAIVLGHRRVYIVPSRLGLYFGAVLLILLVGSINYALSLGFALTFLLAGLGLAGMVQTTRNLATLAVHAGRAEPAFAGDTVQFRLALANAADFDRPEILLRHLASGAQCRVDVGAGVAAEVVLAVPAARSLPASGDPIRRITALYIALRYGPAGAAGGASAPAESVVQLRRMVKELSFR